MQNEKITIITNGNYFARIISERLFEMDNARVAGVLIVTGDYKSRTGIKAVYELGKVTAWPYLVYKILSVLVFKVAAKTHQSVDYDVESLAKAHKVPILHVVSLKDSKALEWVKSLNADLIVSVSCPQLIGKKYLESASLGGINIHSSLLPAYAGLAPYFWTLSQGEKVTGTSVHYMSLKFDQGNILSQRKLEIIKGESAFHLFWRLAVEGRDALYEGVTLALKGDQGQKQDLSQYSYFSNPSLSAYLALRKQGHVLFRISEFWDALKNRLK